MKRGLVSGIALGALMIGSAGAADLVQKAPPLVVPPPFTWSGLYVGGNIGGAWAPNTITDVPLGLVLNNNSDNGVFIGGYQIGVNYQIPASGLVLGVEWDADWAANRTNGNGVFSPTLGQTLAVTENHKWVTTLAARFGVAFDHWLFYGKAGAGLVGNNDFTITSVTTGATVSTLNDTTNTAWVVGAGVEWAFTNSWTAKVEYDYLGLSNTTTSVPPGAAFLAGDTITVSNRDLQMVKVGINYLFSFGGPAPVVSKY